MFACLRGSFLALFYLFVIVVCCEIGRRASASCGENHERGTGCQVQADRLGAKRDP